MMIIIIIIIIITTQIKASAEGKTNKTYEVFVAKSFKTQVVAGTNYFIKVQNHHHDMCCVIHVYSCLFIIYLCDHCSRFLFCVYDAAPLQVHVGGEDHIHLRVFQALPHQGTGPELSTLQEGKSHHDDIDYFQ